MMYQYNMLVQCLHSVRWPDECVTSDLRLLPEHLLMDSIATKISTSLIVHNSVILHYQMVEVSETLAFPCILQGLLTILCAVFPCLKFALSFQVLEDKPLSGASAAVHLLLGDFPKSQWRRHGSVYNNYSINLVSSV